MEKKAEGGTGIVHQLPTLVFMGTPDFAVPSLRKLAASGATIPLVVTQPDRPSGRGKKLTPPPVKEAAEALGIPVYQPDRIRKPEALELIRSHGADCLAVVAYGQILPQALLDMHPLGAINVHGSLLPKYRGAAPIQRALLAGETQTGISIMLLDAGMDTGPVLCRSAVCIGDSETFGELRERLSILGADLLVDTLRRWKSEEIVPKAQDEALASGAPPITKDELRLEWAHAAGRIVDRIRAFDPSPGAFFMLGGKRVKCFRASLPGVRSEGKPGELLGGGQGGLLVLGGDGNALSIADLQMEGQRRMSAGEFVRGRLMPAGSLLG